MFQLESVSHIYSFHSYEKHLIRILVPENLRQLTDAENPEQAQSMRNTGNNSSIIEMNSTLLLFQDQLHSGQFPARFSEFDEQCLERLLQLEADVYLVGTGESATFPDRALHQQIYSQKLAIDFMDNGAACRTYNILSNEDRKAAALIFLDN